MARVGPQRHGGGTAQLAASVNNSFCNLNTTGLTVRDRIPVGTRFSPVQTGPGVQPTVKRVPGLSRG